MLGRASVSALITLSVPSGFNTCSSLPLSCMIFSCAEYSKACRSAAVKFSVLLAMTLRFMSSVFGRSLARTLRMSTRSVLSGISRKIHLSSLPGLRRAGSTKSGREVAATTNTPSKPSTPSIAVKSVFTTRSETPVVSPPRLGAMLSNSSKNNIHGLAADARLKTSLTAASLAPIYLLKSSGPLIPIIRNPNSPAHARARYVFPHPDGPKSKTPLCARRGDLENIKGNLVGSSRASRSDCFAFSRPPMSENLTFAASP
mmetsp:Transcript_12167/g.37080  ORF Transcript_12167/g.37080 Transcript_12167/m.37080 type:complete len:258 (+) Transcript_12167:2287-3060(+)